MIKTFTTILVAILLSCISSLSQVTYTMFPGSSPSNTDPNDPASVELGCKFQTSVPGFVTAIRFYKLPTNTGQHTGNLWSSAGALLASVAFIGETASGWQQISLPSAVAISAGTIYTVSYHTVGHYAFAEPYFTTAITSGPFSLPINAGVYRYATGSVFPTSVWNSSNYWVDVVFQAATPTPTPTPTPFPTPTPTPAPTPTPTPSPAPGSVMVAWDIPAGYNVYYGTVQGGPYSNKVNVGNVSSYTVTGLTSGTYYAIVKSYSASGVESTCSSNEIVLVVP